MYKITLEIPDVLAGCIIGHRGETVRKLDEQTGAKIHVGRKEDAYRQRIAGSRSGLVRPVNVTGPLDSVTRAQRMIAEELAARALDVARRMTLKQQQGARVECMSVPNAATPFLIGDGGKTVREISEDSGAHVKVLSMWEMLPGSRETDVLICGRDADIAAARNMLQARLAQARGELGPRFFDGKVNQLDVLAQPIRPDGSSSGPPVRVVVQPAPGTPMQMAAGVMRSQHAQGSAGAYAPPPGGGGYVPGAPYVPLQGGAYAPPPGAPQQIQQQPPQQQRYAPPPPVQPQQRVVQMPPPPKPQQQQQQQWAPPPGYGMVPAQSPAPPPRQQPQQPQQYAQPLPPPPHQPPPPSGQPQWAGAPPPLAQQQQQQPSAYPGARGGGPPQMQPQWVQQKAQPPPPPRPSHQGAPGGAPPPLQPQWAQSPGSAMHAPPPSASVSFNASFDEYDPAQPSSSRSAPQRALRESSRIAFRCSDRALRLSHAHSCTHTHTHTLPHTIYLFLRI